MACFRWPKKFAYNEMAYWSAWGLCVMGCAKTGLFLSVRDIENPEWHMKWRDKYILKKWYEILQQEINERKV